MNKTDYRRGFNKSDFWAKGDDHMYYHIKEGTGDNLLEEDIEDGYVDYIYYDYYASLNDIEDNEIFDGGQIMLKKLYKDMSVKEIIKEVRNFEIVKLKVIE